MYRDHARSCYVVGYPRGGVTNPISFVPSFSQFLSKLSNSWLPLQWRIMSAIASQITGVSIVCTPVWSGADQWKHQSSASLAFVMGIYRWPMNSPNKGPVTRKMFPFDNIIILVHIWQMSPQLSCGDICQIGIWFDDSNVCFCKI